MLILLYCTLAIYSYWYQKLDFFFRAARSLLLWWWLLYEPSLFRNYKYELGSLTKREFANNLQLQANKI